ncbi:hypothetical protein EV193_104383 [Herbihabitans rhizosphaerae]|uniref:Uncharacterized protein n=1 Tax=Herbihabitans rhizosphaerae TaxID=1872711 RepID=A0A4Q7KRQ9_9PSEU|nr:hypothetical protein EV193_104383 [Herbihabitans rhizosphaerae]
MARHRFSYENAYAPGDIRALGAGDVIVLTESVRERANWESIVCALPIAAARGASVIWEEST